MPTITAEPTTASQLSNMTSVTEVKDVNGRFLGVFAPGSPEQARLYLHAWLTQDPESIRKQKAGNEVGYSYAQVRAHLASLEGT